MIVIRPIAKPLPFADGSVNLCSKSTDTVNGLHLAWALLLECANDAFVVSNEGED